MSQILVFLPNGQSRAVRLDRPRMHIGRAPHNAIVLPDLRVSAVHALLQHTASGWWIEDLGSTNGTWVNDQRVQSSLWLAQDVVRIGACTLRLLLAADAVRPARSTSVDDRIDENWSLPSDFAPTDLMRHD